MITLECVRAYSMFTPADRMIAQGLQNKDGSKVVLCEVPPMRWTNHEGKRFNVRTKKEAKELEKSGLWKVVA